MAVKMKIIFLISILSILQSCESSIQIKSPTKKEMAIGLEKANKAEKKLETELRIIKDLDEGISQAQKEDKPILLIFTGLGVVNSRKLEREVLFENEKIYSLMKDKFINVWLYVDDRKGKGKKWGNLQFFEFKGNHQPQIFILDSKGNKLSRIQKRIITSSEKICEIKKKVFIEKYFQCLLAANKY